MCGKTRQDKIRNDNIKEMVGITPRREKWWEIDFGGFDM